MALIYIYLFIYHRNIFANLFRVAMEILNSYFTGTKSAIVAGMSPVCRFIPENRGKLHNAFTLTCQLELATWMAEEQTANARRYSIAS